MPVALPFTWNFLETDIFNLTGDLHNVNLVGAITRLQTPLTMDAISPGNIVILEFGAFAIIAGLLWLLGRNSKGCDGMNFRIRSALPRDKDFILSLASRFSEFALPEWRATSEVDITNHRLLQKALEQPEPGSAVFVAEAENGQPAGFIHLETEADFFGGDPHGYISYVGVDKVFEGQGVGQILIEQAETWTRQQGYGLLTLYVFAGNLRAQRLYQKTAFSPELIKYAKEIK